jgi:uncharacterized surface protein with fasciclin (FAS1) repeats
MKKYINHLYTRLFAVLLLFLVLGSCEETWDDHYQADESANTELLYQKLEASPDLSKFVELLKEVDYFSVMQYPQAYTVFAPVNDAFSAVSDEVLNDPDQLKALLGNHICRYSYSSVDALGNPKLKMFNGKYEDFTSSGGQLSFSGSNLSSSDDLCGNGILHKVSSVVSVKPNIWDYMNLPDMFPSIMAYLEPYNNLVFDDFNSVAIGKNTLGEIIYDSVYVASNAYFDVIGDLNSEELQFTFLGLNDDVYADVYQDFEGYFSHPDSATVVQNVNKTIVGNLVLPAVSKNELTGGYLSTTTRKQVKVDANQVTEEVELSNGYMFLMNELNLEPTKIMYKPVRFEVEETEGRKIGKSSDFTIQKKYNASASGYFRNVVTLLKDPSGTNNYFEVSFDEVCSADYDIYIKFDPIGASKGTKLKYALSYSNMDGSETSIDIEGGVIAPDFDERLKIGDTYSFPVYVNRVENSNYTVKFRVYVDVSSAELILYDRNFGIDYIELVPVQ